MPTYKTPTPTPGPIHDHYKYPMVETKPPARESLYQKARKALGMDKPKNTQDAKVLADRADQAKKLKGEY